MAKKWDANDAKANLVQMYKTILEREPDPDGLATYMAMLTSGEYSIHDIVGYMALSPEYEERFVTHNTPQQAVELAYEKILGRKGDGEGLRVNTEIAQREGVHRVIELFLSSAEYHNSWGEDSPPMRVDE